MWQQKAHAKVNELFRFKKMMDQPDWIGAMFGVSVTTGVTQNSNRVGVEFRICCFERKFL